ncbi:hypothetical protein AYM40_19840 [Paraburkholderia phytofirmans OLGA172]|uniref:Uncharacterized protein n=1 Tax=Paraburkholderia phytofirmans OLGA172 TaxID=1417228 RepID=A0A167W633_9BURK|nr:hypothetical protein AYM40_19840 [Paraburkholderia phytofirmans OLGA172]
MVYPGGMTKRKPCPNDMSDEERSFVVPYLMSMNKEAVYQQTQRWLEAGCFEAMLSDVRSILRVAQGR